MAFYIGDIPSEPVVIPPARGEDPIDLAPFDEGETEVALRDFAGDVVDAVFPVTFDDDEQGSPVVTVGWPDVTPFETGGLYTLVVTLVGLAARERLAPVYFVAQDDATGWHTIDTARGDWEAGEAPVDDARLFQLLDLAREQVEEFAPALADDSAVPSRYRAGQLGHAQNLYNAGRVDPASGNVGDEDFTLRPYPLDWHIKQILRPKRGMKVIG